MDDDNGDEYDYEYEDEEDIDDEYESGAGEGEGEGEGPSDGGSARRHSSSVGGAEDLTMRDETVAFIDQAQLKSLMSKVVADIRWVWSCSVLGYVTMQQNGQLSSIGYVSLGL